MAIHPLYKDSIKKIESINPAIEILSHLSSLIQDPNTKLSHIGDIMRTDASLTSDIIKLSNSSFYSYATLNSNIDDALSRIGFTETYKWINVSIATNLSNKDLTHYNITAQEFWSTNVATALLMEALTLHIGGNASDAYTIGTLYAIGKIAINDILESDQSDSIWDKSCPAHEWEENVIGASHAHTSAEMLKRWGFPEKIYSVIDRYINPSEKSLFMINALNYSKLILKETDNDFSHSSWKLPDNQKFLLNYDIKSDEMRNIIKRVSASFSEIRKVMKMAKAT